jgi:hypothetical protein
MRCMKSALHFFIAFLILMLMYLPCPASTAQAEKPKGSPNPYVLAEFDQVRQDIAALSTLNKGQRTSLIQKLTNAAAAYRRSQPCTAVNILDAYLNETQALRKGSLVATAEQLYGMGRFLRGEVLGGLPSGVQCNQHKSFGLEPAITLTFSDNTRLAGRFSLGEAAMWPVSGGGEQFTKVTIPGVSFIGLPGFPGVPVVRRLIAVPHGATAQIYAANPTVAETVHVNLYPFQQSPADQTEPIGFGDPPFVKNTEAYASHGPFPQSVCTVTILGQTRDLTTAQLACAAGRYDPVNDVLTLFSNVEFDVRFEGGNGYFVTQRALSPFEPPVLNPDHVKLFVNWPEILKHVDYSQYEPDCYGEELLIFTPPDLKPAADKLAQWKKDKGILTSVVVFDPSGESVPPVKSMGDINRYVNSRYDHCTVRPSYILLFGDADRVPTWYVATFFSDETASDYPYALGTDPAWWIEPPSFAVGRIPVDNLEQAEQVVAKIISYEKNPPGDAAFYQNASILAQFECCKYEDFPMAGVGSDVGWDLRTFVENAEFARNVLLSHNYVAERIYTEKIYGHDYLKDPTPRRYADGGDLPPDLTPENGFVWIESGSNDAKNRVVSAFNAGRFLILQRNHGLWNGWMGWQFSSDDVNGLTNGPLLPVVFSISCNTAFFDNETNPGERDRPDHDNPYPSSHVDWPNGGENETYFAERLIRHPNGGAIGLIGATRGSQSDVNDVLTKGILDAVWPDAIPDFGGNTGKRRLGDILNHGKNYLLTQQGTEAEAGWKIFWDEFYLYNLIGDPTLEMWTAPPGKLPAKYLDLQFWQTRLELTYPDDGATITAFQDAEDGMVPIGRAVVKDGKAMLEYVVVPRDGLPILLSASKANTVSVLLGPETIPCPLCK